MLRRHFRKNMWRLFSLAIAAFSCLWTPGSSSYAADILFMVDNAVSPINADGPIADRLSNQGHTVTFFRTANTTQEAQSAAAAEADLVLISESVSSVTTVFNGSFSLKESATPVISYEAYMFDDAVWNGPTENVDFGATARTGGAGLGLDGAQDTVYIQSPAHPLAAGLSAGAVQIYNSPYAVNYSVPGPQADVIATVDEAGSFAAIFVYDAGDELADGTATPAARIGFFLGQSSDTNAPDPPDWDNVTTQGMDLLDAAVAYALAQAPVETCANGADDDGDGVADCDDSDCEENPVCQCMPTEESETNCDDGIDNDCDENVDDADVDCPAIVDFETHVQPIFSANCSCHLAPGGRAGLDLRAGNAYDNLVGQPSTQVPGMSRVTAGDTAESYVWHKISGTHDTVGGTGSRMPPNGPPFLTDHELAIIERWINDETGSPCKATGDTENNCEDGNDDDCDGLVDDADTDCQCTPSEEVETTCDDGTDNDCDENVDDADTDCQCMPTEEVETTCDDGTDNDCDENVDDADDDCQGVGPFLRGDCDGNGVVGGSPTEAIVLLNFAFRGGEAPGCLAACDAEANGSIGITDALRILRHSFLGLGEPDPPFPDCTTSDLETDVALGCTTLSVCK